MGTKWAVGSLRWYERREQSGSLQPTRGEWLTRTEKVAMTRQVSAQHESPPHTWVNKYRSDKMARLEANGRVE
jgi:hypothetical protein